MPRSSQHCELPSSSANMQSSPNPPPTASQAENAAMVIDSDTEESNEDQNSGAEEMSKGELAHKVGKLSYEVVTRKQFGGRGKVATVWIHGANISFQEPGEKVQQCWLCKECRLDGFNIRTQFYNAYDHNASHSRLSREHRIGCDGNELPPAPDGPIKRHLVKIVTATLQDYDQNQ